MTLTNADSEKTIRKNVINKCSLKNIRKTVIKNAGIKQKMRKMQKC